MRPRTRGLLLIALSGAAGYIDALSYLGLGHVFTANMTGNTVLLGIALGQRDLGGAGRSAIALAGFCLGVVAGTLAAGPPDRRPKEHPWPRGVTLTLMVEALLLVALAAAWPYAGTVPLIVLAGAAMGIQSSAGRVIGVPGVATTYVTGTMTNVVSKVVENLVAWLVGTGEPNGEARRPVISGARLQAMVWVVYGIAAVAGGAAQLTLPRLAPWPAAVLVAAVVLTAAAQSPLLRPPSASP